MVTNREIKVALNGFIFFQVFGTERVELREVLGQGSVALVLTPRLVQEYESVASGLHLPTAEVLRLLEDARGSCRIIARIGALPRPRGIPKHHRAILVQACGAGATHLVTEWDQWLERAQYMEREHRLRVLTPDDFVREVNQ